MRDKLDWHASSAVDNGQPEEHGFVHIACFLHWLGLRGWLEPSLFSKADRARIADGSIPLADLIHLTDEQLSSDMATPEGADFGEARYDAYIGRWSEIFPTKTTSPSDGQTTPAPAPSRCLTSSTPHGGPREA